MKKLLTFFCLFLAIQSQAFAQAWYGGSGGGQQPITYTFPHPLGDGATNTRGGEAPYFTNGETADIPTDATIKSNWTINCPAYNTGICGTSGFESPDGTNSVPSGAVGHEAKARFDCNDTAEEKSDPIIHPGQAGTNSHRHEFFGNTSAAGNMQLVTYSYLRNNGYSTCYGGPMNRTLYWHPTLYVIHNGIPIPLKARNVVTYYLCNGGISPSNTARCTRWPRGFAEIGGFDMADPTNTRVANKLNNVGGTFTDNPSQYGGANSNGFAGWKCAGNHTPSYTAYAPNQTQGAAQPYLNDGNGHETLNCMTASELVTAGIFSAMPSGSTSSSILVEADIDFPECWDGHNATSPDGRSHVQQGVSDSRAASLGLGICPDHWYFIPQFSAHIQYMFQNVAEMQTAYLSSDRMPGMTQFKGGQAMHADVFPGWDYGTGDNPGFMLTFFQHCLGLTMHVKNSDGTTYTDLPGDPHECGYGRMAQTKNAVVNSAPPDGQGPNPVVNLDPDQSCIKRYFPLPSGTQLPSAVLHQRGSGTSSTGC